MSNLSVPGRAWRQGRRYCPGAGRLLVLIWVGFLLFGCGLKGDPVPFKSKQPASIKDLTAGRVQEGVLLTWTVREGAQNLTGFRIRRGEIPPGCPTCPPKFTVVDEIKIKTRPAGKEERFTYLDKGAAPAEGYVWRVEGCRASGQCLEPSNTAGINKSEGTIR